MTDRAGDLTLDAELDLGEQLPLVYRKAGSRAGAIIAMVFGGLFAAAPTSVIVLLVFFGDGSVGDDIVVHIVLAVLLIGGLSIVLLGVAVMRSAHDLRIDRQWVSMRTRGLFSSEQWQQPLNSYDGVMASEKSVSSAGSAPGHTLYYLTLKHRHDAKCHVPLYASRGRDGFRESAERFARLLDLPVLTEGAGGGVQRREVADLDSSTRERVERGSIPLASSAPGVVTSSLRVRDSGDGCEFRVGFMSFGGIAWACVLVLGGAGVGGWQWTLLGGDGLAIGWSVLAVILLVLGLLALLVTATGNSSLRVQRDGVVLRLSLGGVHLSERRLAQQDIEEVTVSHSAYGRPRLEVVGDPGRLVFDHWKLDVAALENVRERVLATLAAE